MRDFPRSVLRIAERHLLQVSARSESGRPEIFLLLVLAILGSLLVGAGGTDRSAEDRLGMTSTRCVASVGPRG